MVENSHIYFDAAAEIYYNKEDFCENLEGKI